MSSASSREPNRGSEGGSRERDGVLSPSELVPIRVEFAPTLESTLTLDLAEKMAAMSEFGDPDR
jgi:hypothetical protein